MDADVAELADATDLGSVALRGVEVQILSSAPFDPDSRSLDCGKGASLGVQVGNSHGPVA